MGDPLNARLTGLCITEGDTMGLPWWCVGILNWLGMVHAIQQATGEAAIYRGALTGCLEDGDGYEYVNTKTGRSVTLHGPAAVYAVYQSFCLKVEELSRR